MSNQTQRRHCGGVLPPSEHGEALLEQVAVGDHHGLPVAGLDGGGTPVDLHHPAWVVSTCSQSPMAMELSSWIETPASRLPRVSCMEKAMTAVMTAEVVTISPRAMPEA